MENIHQLSVSTFMDEGKDNNGTYLWSRFLDNKILTPLKIRLEYPKGSADMKDSITEVIKTKGFFSSSLQSFICSLKDY